MSDRKDYIGGFLKLKVAVMQPYFFPYIGYFQLIASVENFVFLDDVSYIKKGFINRNRILLPSGVYDFTIPVRSRSQNKPINKHFYTGDFYVFLAQLRHAYSKSIYFDSVFPWIEEICLDSEFNVAKKNIACIEAVCRYLKVEVNFSVSSSIPKAGLNSQDRILQICKYLNASSYHNASGGKEIYDADLFKKSNISLKFIRNSFSSYAQFGSGFFKPGLSILDVLFSNSVEDAHKMVYDYGLESA